MDDYIAAIDIGTNSVLMLLARSGGGGSFEIVSDQAIITRLGQGLVKGQAMAPVAMQRTFSALRAFAEQARAKNARIIAVGTATLRDATNANGFLTLAEELLGVPVRIISGSQEAELTYRGALDGLELPAETVTVVDVGGGSTEIVRHQTDRHLETMSLRMGAVRLFERHELTAPATAGQLSIVAREVDDILEQNNIESLGPLVAVGGTATTVAAIIDEIQPYDPKRIHGRCISKAELGSLVQRLAEMSLDERRGLKGLEKGREDIIVTGAIILERIMERAGIEQFVVSNGGVRVGLLAEAFADTH